MKKPGILIIMFLIISCSSSFTGFPKIDGWNPGGELRIYNTDNLYEYINGAAEQYIEYGFQMLQSRDITRDAVTVTVDVYDMGSSLNALGMYKIERPPDGNVYKIGTEASITPPYQCLMLKDQYYIKVGQFEGDITEETGTKLLAAIAEEIPGDDSLPAEFSLLPEAGRIPGTESFAREGFSGMSELKNCVFSDYEGEFQYFILLPQSAEEPLSSIWDTLAKKWKHLKYENNNILYRKIPYKGLVGIIMHENKMLGAAGCKDEAALIDLLTK